MEKNFNTDNFEQLLREATDNFRMYPSKRVWHGIYNDLHPAKKWPSFAVLLLLVTSIMYIGVTNPNKGGQPLAEISSDGMENTTASGSRGSGGDRSASSSIVTATPTLTSNITTRTDLRNPKYTSAQPSRFHVASVQNSVGDLSQTNTDRLNFATSIKGKTSSNNNNRIDRSASNSVTNIAALSRADNTVLTANSEATQLVSTFASPFLQNEAKLDMDKLSTESVNHLSVVKPAVLSTTSTNVITNSAISGMDESGWMEDYAMRNMRLSAKMKGRMAYQVYVTPSLGYRTLRKNRDYSLPPTNALVANPYAPSTTDITLNHSSAINLELGAGVIYSASKLIRLRAGVQFNYTNYSVNAEQLNHPTFTSLMLTNRYTNAPVLTTRTTSIANTSGASSRYLNNSTYQVSIPVGVDVRIAGNDQLKVYLGGTLQPTYIFGGQAYLVSADMKNYIADESFLRKHNLNGAVEAFVTYKTKSGVTLNAGPQIRYQLFSTYNEMYTYDEKLYNIGVKLGMTKNF